MCFLSDRIMVWVTCVRENTSHTFHCAYQLQACLSALKVIMSCESHEFLNLQTKQTDKNKLEFSISCVFNSLFLLRLHPREHRIDIRSCSVLVQFTIQLAQLISSCSTVDFQDDVKICAQLWHKPTAKSSEEKRNEPQTCEKVD